MPPIHVIGAGGIGCAVGYALRAAGVPVVFVDADAGKVAWGRQHGVQVEGRPALDATFLTFAEWQPVPESVVLLCTKCYDNPAVLERLTVPVQLVPIQNGFDRILDKHGHAWEGIAAFVSECRPGQTCTRITRRGRLHLGMRGNSVAASDLAILEPLRCTDIFDVEVVPNILPYKYTKLLYNAAISPLAAAAGLDNGQLLSVPAARLLFFGLIRENYAILRGAGISLAKVGPFHPATVQHILRYRWIANSFAWAFYPTLRGSYCSMFGDLPRGRTEIDNYNGHLIELAGERPCALNQRVYNLVKRMERESIPPQRSMLEQLGQPVGPGVACTRLPAAR